MNSDVIRQTAKNNLLYLLMEWSTNIISLLSLTLIYRFSAEGAELANNAWLLSLVATSLFVSVATQYYVMIRGEHALYAYVSFLPIVVSELVIIALLLPLLDWIYVAAIILSTLGIHACKGELMARGRLPIASFISLFEQLLRVVTLLIFYYVFQKSISQILLLSLLCSYLISLGLSFAFYWKFRVVRQGVTNVREAFNYACIYFSIYLIINIDMISLKVQPHIHAEFSLMKPWGTVIVTLTIPFINIYLTRKKANQSTRRIIQLLISLCIVYLVSTYLFAGTLNQIIFNKSLPSQNYTLLVISEHLAIALLIALYHDRLRQRKKTWEMLAVSTVLSTIIILFSYTLPGNSIYLAFMLTFISGCGFILIRNRRGVESIGVSR